MPSIIVPDASPLIHLAAAGLLDVLTRMGQVVVPDVVLLEATRVTDKPWSAEILEWCNASPVDVVETEVGALYRIAVRDGLKPPRHAGELSMIEWLRDGLGEWHGSALVIYEDGRVPKMVSQETLSIEVVVMTTHSFLELAEESGMINSADDAWQTIQSVVPTASPALGRMTRKPQP